MLLRADAHKVVVERVEQVVEVAEHEPAAGDDDHLVERKLYDVGLVDEVVVEDVAHHVRHFEDAGGVPYAHHAAEYEQDGCGSACEEVEDEGELDELSCPCALLEFPVFLFAEGVGLDVPFSVTLVFVLCLAYFPQHVAVFVTFHQVVEADDGLHCRQLEHPPYHDFHGKEHVSSPCQEGGDDECRHGD